MKQCSKRIPSLYLYEPAQCQNRGKFEYLGKFYCGTHYPPNVEKRRVKGQEKSEKRLEAEAARRLKNAYGLVADDLGITVRKLKGKR